MDTEALRLLIRDGETSTIEFKVAPPRVAELAERICGFANSLGGMLIIGVVDKTWEIVGVRSSSETVDVLLQAARLCKPTVQFRPSLPQIVEINEKELVLAHIPPNDGTLYQAGGVCWTRRGTYTVPLEIPEIEAFLYHRGTLAWEAQPVLRATLEDLDMTLVETFLEGRPIRNKVAGRLSRLDEILINLGSAIAVEDERNQQIIRPTNAGMLLFGYSPQQFLIQAEVVCVLYLDNLGMRRYADRRILHGTITQQIDQAEVFFKQYVPVAGYMDGFHRRDEPDYPLDALREAVVNAVVHRDYSLRGEAVRIFYYPNRIEIHNPGLLLPGITLIDLQQGKVRSKLRNPVIGTVLRDLPGGYMERVGSGITYMIDQMRKLGRPEPQFKEQGEIVVTFLKATPPVEDSSRTEASSSRQVPLDSAKQSSIPASIDELDSTREERQKLALRFVHEHGSITNRKYRDITGISGNTALRDLDELVERGSLRAIGNKRARRYTLP
ncbi:MAG TPA: ATP-binding protein [Ktedonobacteraceae bacterium]|nr:ATP-binding protein [Ktedonobacteraceae bacterium]